MMKLQLSVCLALSALTTTAQNISTIAGSHAAGYSGDGGPATTAKMNMPAEMVADASGNIYIADFGNNVVRKIDPTGVISTFAGNGMAGFSGDGGPATAAKLHHPGDVVIDGSGNVYITDHDNFRVRKVDASGVITTFAGNGTAGYSGNGGPATAAMLGGPFSLTFDAAGNLLIADGDANVIRKVSTAGIISTFAGDTASGYSGDGGPATAARFFVPASITCDNAGNFYIADFGNQVVRKINASGVVSTVAGTGVSGYSPDGGQATASKLNFPNSVCVDAGGNLYISDAGSNRVRKVNSVGTISTVAGIAVAGYTGDGGPATAAEIKNASGISFDSHDNLLIADNGNHVVRKVTYHDDAISSLRSSFAGEVTIYPNPANDVINVDLVSTENEMLAVVIDDIGGRRIAEFAQRVNEGRNHLSLNVGTLGIQPGNYALTLTDGNGSSVAKKVMFVRGK